MVIWWKGHVRVLNYEGWVLWLCEYMCTIHDKLYNAVLCAGKSFIRSYFLPQNLRCKSCDIRDYRVTLRAQMHQFCRILFRTLCTVSGNHVRSEALEEQSHRQSNEFFHVLLGYYCATCQTGILSSD